MSDSTAPASKRSSLIEGDRTGTATVEKARALIKASERVVVILDCHHAKAHTTRELRANAGLVTAGGHPPSDKRGHGVHGRRAAHSSRLRLA